jgi:hypothetical protein
VLNAIVIGFSSSALAHRGCGIPDADSYVYDSNYFNPHWQAALWGGNYRLLQAAKAAYDPDRLFLGHNGVGSEDRSADGFTRIG